MNTKLLSEKNHIEREMGAQSDSARGGGYDDLQNHKRSYHPHE